MWSQAGLSGSALVVGLHDPRSDLLHPDGPTANAEVWLAATADSGGSLARRGLYFASETREPRARKLWEVSEQLTEVTISL